MVFLAAVNVLDIHGVWHVNRVCSGQGVSKNWPVSLEHFFHQHMMVSNSLPSKGRKIFKHGWPRNIANLQWWVIRCVMASHGRRSRRRFQACQALRFRPSYSWIEQWWSERFCFKRWYTIHDFFETSNRVIMHKRVSLASTKCPNVTSVCRFSFPGVDLIGKQWGLRRVFFVFQQPLFCIFTQPS